MKKVILYILVFFVIIILSACKKYPENTLWFKFTKNITFFNGVKLTQFSVNGIDSLQSLNSFFGSKSLKKDIQKCSFDAWSDDLGSTINGGIFICGGTAGVDGNIEIGASYTHRGKFINIHFNPFNDVDSSVFSRNLFIDNVTPWRILKLEVNGARRISKTVNGNTYILQFE